MVTVHVLNHRDRDSWRYFPEYQKRVKTFATAYDSDVDPDLLSQYMRMSFVSDQPTCLMMVGLDADDIIVGHALVIAEKWFGNPVITIVQLEMNRGTVLSLNEWAQGKSVIQGFCAMHSAKFIQLAARNRAAARLFSRHGFQETRVIMRLPVEGRAPHPST